MFYALYSTFMKKDIHPTYNPKVIAKCACGQKFEVGSTMPEIQVEICSACHPFYTGKENLLDTAGRVEKFKKRKAAGDKHTVEQGEKKKK